MADLIAQPLYDDGGMKTGRQTQSVRLCGQGGQRGQRQGHRDSEDFHSDTPISDGDLSGSSLPCPAMVFGGVLPLSCALRSVANHDTFATAKDLQRSSTYCPQQIYTGDPVGKDLVNHGPVGSLVERIGP